MESQRTIDWNAAHEAEERDRGMALAAGAHPDKLLLARGIAKALAAAHPERTTSSNEVRRKIEADGLNVRWGNWAGSIFNEPGVWEDVGVTRSEHPGGHRRKITVWRLVA